MEVKESSVSEILTSLREALVLDRGETFVRDLKKLREKHLDSLVLNAVFHPNPETKRFLIWLLQSVTQSAGVIPASLATFYRLKAHDKLSKQTIPSFRVEDLAYDAARALFRAAKNNSTMAFLFECPVSLGNSMGSQDEFFSGFSAVVASAALREGWAGPIFIQNEDLPLRKETEFTETSETSLCIANLFRAGVYNLNIDVSNCLDSTDPTLEGRHRLGSEVAANALEWIRRNQPSSMSVSIGVKIGLTQQNVSSVDELRIFMDGFIQELKKKEPSVEGINKVFLTTKSKEELEALSQMAMTAYKLAGIVQSDEGSAELLSYESFAKINVAELHLRRLCRNTLMESALPQEFHEHFKKPYHKNEIQTLKTTMWDLSPSIRREVSERLQRKFDSAFKGLGSVNTSEDILEEVETVKVNPYLPESIKKLVLS